MNERSNRYAINALKERRAEIDGEIEACRRKLENLTEAIVHLDASIALLDPTYDPASVRPKRFYRRGKLFGGKKLTGLILDALRRAERALTTQEVVAAIAGVGASAPNVTKRVRMALRYLAKRGAVFKEGERKTARWRLV
jgi:SRSO17 transposase